MTIRYLPSAAIPGAILLLAPLVPVFAAEPYLPGEIYVGGDQVCFAGDLFRAKWWAGPEDRPSDVDQVAQPWDTPWERLQVAAPACDGLNDGNRPPQVQLTADPLSLSGAGQIRLSAAGSVDPDADPLSYRWQQLAPESIQVSFDAPSAAETLVSLPEPTAATGYVFEVQVSDGELSRSAQVTIIQSVPGDSAGICPSWDADTVYVGTDLVAHAGAIWEAQWWTQGEVPGTTGEWGVWRPAPADALCAADPSDPTDPSDPNDPDDPTDPIDPNDPEQVRLSDLLATEAALTDSPLMASVKASIRTLDNALVERILPGATTNPANVQRVERLVSEQDWDAFFPRRAPEYTYTNFLKGIGKFPAFCGDYDDGRDADAICRAALATMFAHF
ncbi:carbohydrate-binding protein, partial [Halochromatium sp.]